jgi:hypothetical protein
MYASQLFMSKCVDIKQVTDAAVAATPVDKE